MSQKQPIDEGVIKFSLNWVREELVEDHELKELILHRDKLFKAGLIGVYEELNVGFGNISIRIPRTKDFYVSGSQTGHIEQTASTDYAKVVAFSIQENWVTSVGETKASSESLTHAILYELDPEINAVIHVHHKGMWESYLHKLPTTGEDVPYGTPEMTSEVARLFAEEQLGSKQVFVMAGHDEGIVSFGSDLESAHKVLMQYYEKLGS